MLGSEARDGPTDLQAGRPSGPGGRVAPPSRRASPVRPDSRWGNHVRSSDAPREVAELSSSGFNIEVEWWDASDGKGIDDLLAAGKVPEVVAGYSLEAHMHDLQKAAGMTGGAAKSASAATGGGEGEKETQAEILLRLASITSLVPH